MNEIRQYLVGLAALLLAASAHAQPPESRLTENARPDRIAFSHLTIEDGLSQNAVNALIQDREGFVWIGTQDGLNRYDGYTFTVYRHDPFDATTLSSSYVTALFEDDDGHIWVGTLAGGLNRLDPVTGTVVRYATTARSHITAIVEDPRGNLWVGTNGAGLLRLARADADRPDATFEPFAFTPGDPNGLSGDEVGTLFVDQQGYLWVSTNKGFGRFEEVQHALVRYGPGSDSREAPPDSRVSALAQTSDGTIWVGTPRGLRRVTDAARGRFSSTLYALPAPLGDRGTVKDIVEGPEGALWFSGGPGLYRFDPATAAYTLFRHTPSDPTSLSGNLLNTLLWDRTGVLWVGTNGYGLDCYDTKRSRFQTIQRPPDLRSPATGFSIRSLFEDASGTLWISAGVLYRYDRRSGVLTHIDTAGGPLSLSTEEVTSIIQDRQGDLWFASQGLHRYDPQSGRTRVYAYDAARPDGLTRRQVYGVFEDQRGTIWIWTPHHISRLDDEDTGRFTHFLHTPDDLAANITPSIHEEAGGFFWLGTDAGLVRFDPRTGDVRRYRTDPDDPASLSQDLVRAILPDPVLPDRVLWIGTAGGGLNRFDVEAETFTHITERDGLPNNVVYGVLPDSEGRLWLSTNRGLARYDSRTGAFKSYDAYDGLQSNEFNAGAYHRAANGRLYFGGIYGVNAFDPDAFTDNPHVPPVVLTRLRIGNRPVAVDDSTGLLNRALWATDALRLSHRENMVTISFAALDFSAPAKNRYAYRMEGFDDDWIQAGTNRTATYTNLPPGRYTFRVQGTNNDGLWNEEGAMLDVFVTPPPWRTWWAYAGYVLLAAGVLTAAYRARRRRHQLRHDLEIEQLEAEKLRELDHARNRFFANVSHEFRTPLTLTLGPLDDMQAGLYGPLAAPMAQQVDLARRNAGRVLDLINQILDVARLESGRTPLRTRPLDLGVFVESVAQPFRAMAARKAMTFEVELPATPVEVYADPPQLEKAVANLLSNALKFTPEGGTVRVSVAAWEGASRVAVRDSGPGIPAADLPYVFDRFYQVGGSTQTQLGTGIGLALAKEVADLHGGTLAVESEEGFGSTFTVTLPLGRAHLAPDQIDEAAGPWTPAATPAAVSPAEPSGDGSADGLADPADTGEEDADDVTTVLVVEDHPEVRAYVRRHLEGGSPAYRVLEAADGEAGLALAKARLPDLVLSDVMMPKLGGLGLCRALKANPETDFIPVILLTAKAAPEDKLEGLGEHADDYLTKPFDVAELRARIGNLIAVRKQLRERFAGEAGDGTLHAEPVAVTSADDIFLERVRETVEVHLGDETFSVERLAEAVGVSRGHLHRQLKALAGQTPSELIRTMRLERGALLLSGGAGTVSEIAYAVGFKSVSYFSDSFVRAYGCRPSDYATSSGTAGDETA